MEENKPLEEKKKKKISTKAWVIYILSTLALILCIYIISSVIAAGNEKRPARIFGLSISYVPSGSMEPTIDTNSYVLFRQASYKECKVDDIIVYYNAKEEKYIIHRVIGKVENGELVSKSSRYDNATILIDTTEQNYLITMGDNNGNKTDTIPVTKGLVYGKYLTGLGFMNIFAGGINKGLIYGLLILIFVIMIGIQTFQMFMNKKVEDAKKQNKQSKELLLEELRKEILEEELAKLKNKQENEKSEDKSSEEAEAPKAEESKEEESEEKSE